MHMSIKNFSFKPNRQLCAPDNPEMGSWGHKSSWKAQRSLTGRKGHQMFRITSKGIDEHIAVPLWKSVVATLWILHVVQLRKDILKLETVQRRAKGIWNDFHPRNIRLNYSSSVRNRNYFGEHENGLPKL